MLTKTSVSIAIVAGLVAKTDVLSNDPVLWFAMMLMPAGPSSMKLEALAEVDEASDDDKMAISKFLTVSALAAIIGDTTILTRFADIIWNISVGFTRCGREPGGNQ